jgi:short-subunit dehydrogenase
VADRGVALVTGASSGIGEQFARLLADAGRDLVVVARRQAALQALADELTSTNKVAVEVLVADLGTADGVEAVCRRIEAEPAVETVVNNAGFGAYGDFVDQDPDLVAELLAVDVVAVTRLSRAALGVFVPRGRGELLNVSSTAGFVPGPHGAAYHAAKAYVTSLTEAIHEEVRGRGVKVTALCPGVTPTGFQERAKVTAVGSLPRAAVTSARSVARAGLDALARNQAICVPGWANQIARLGSQVAPRPVVRRLSGQVLRRL